MKKLLGISLVALFTAVPMLASAADPVPPSSNFTADSTEAGLGAGTNVPVAAKGAYYAGKSITDTDKITTASAAYVKGAYNDTISAINKVSVDAANAANGAISSALTEYTKTTAMNNAISTAKTEAIAAAGTATSAAISALDSTVSQTTGDLTLEVKETDGKLTSVSGSINNNSVTSAKIVNGTIVSEDIAQSTIALDRLSTAVQASLAAADEAATALSSAISALDSTVSQTAGDLTLEVKETDGKLTSVSGSINNNSVTSAKIVNGTIVSEDIAQSTIAADRLSTAVQASLSKAESALQSSAIANMAEKAGVLATINSATASVSGVSLGVSGSVSGTVPLMVIWGEASPSGTAAVNGTISSATATGSINNIDVAAPAAYKSGE